VLHDTSILSGSLDNHLPLPTVVGHGLFYINILSGLASQNGGQGMPVIRRGTHDRRYRLIVQSPPKILYTARFPTLPIGNFFCLRELAGIHIAQVGNFAILLGSVQKAMGKMDSPTP
jgi:hypothetical protein